MKWEYKVVELWVEREEELNGLGLEGWELVHIDADLNAYLKRPNPQQPAKCSEDDWVKALARAWARTAM